MTSLHSPSPIKRIDRSEPADFAPLAIGPYTVRRARLAGTPYTRYSIMAGEDIAGHQISYPDENDCLRHISRFHSGAKDGRQKAAMLDTDLHARIVGILGTKEMDARDLCHMFSKTVMVMAPVLSMLTLEGRIVRRGTVRRPIYTAPPAQMPTL